jgi:hypothetical protein
VRPDTNGVSKENGSAGEFEPQGRSQLRFIAQRQCHSYLMKSLMVGIASQDEIRIVRGEGAAMSQGQGEDIECQTTRFQVKMFISVPADRSHGATFVALVAASVHA